MLAVHCGPGAAASLWASLQREHRVFELVPYQVLVWVPVLILLCDLGHIASLPWASVTLSVNGGNSPEFWGRVESRKKSRCLDPPVGVSYPVGLGLDPVTDILKMHPR